MADFVFLTAFSIISPLTAVRYPRLMYKFLRQGFQDFPTSLGPNGEVILNLARCELERIEQVPQSINVLILDYNYIRRLENLANLYDLRQLSVAGNKLFQMHGVAPLVNLTILNLPQNAIVAIDVVYSPEDYEPLLLAYLPKLQILNGENVEPDTRARAKLLRVEQFSSEPDCASSDRELVMQASVSSQAVDSNPCPESSQLEPPSLAKSCTDHQLLPNSDIKNPPISLNENHIPGGLPNHTQVDGDFSQSSEVSRSRSSNPPDPLSQCELSPAVSRTQYTEHSDLPAVSLRRFIEDGSAAIQDSSDHQHESPKIQVFGSPAPSPKKSSFEGAPHMSQASEVSNNPVASSLLMSESVYLPVSAPVYPARSSSPEIPFISTRSSKAQFQSYYPHSKRGVDSPSTAGCNEDSTPCPTTGVIRNSLVYGPGRELDSSRTVIPPDHPVDFQGAPQSSFSMTPLICSTESTEYQADPRTPTTQSADVRVPAAHTQMIDNVYLIHDEEDHEGEELIGAPYQSSQIAPACIHMSQSCHAGTVGSTTNQRSGHSVSVDSQELLSQASHVNLNELLLRSHAQPGEVVARSLDSWMQSYMFCSPAGNSAKTRGADLRHPAPFRNSSERSSLRPVQQLPHCLKTPPSRKSNLPTPNRTHNSPLVDNQSLHKFEPESQRTLTQPPEWSSVSRPSTSEGLCSSCGFHPGMLQDHIVFLRTQLQAQYEAAQAEAKLRQLHSKAIEFLLQEVQELKAWKEEASKQLRLSNELNNQSRRLTTTGAPDSLSPSSTSISAFNAPSQSVLYTTSARGDTPPSQKLFALCNRSPQQHATQQMTSGKSFSDGFPRLSNGISSNHPSRPADWRAKQEVINVYDSDAEDIGTITGTSHDIVVRPPLEVRPTNFQPIPGSPLATAFEDEPNSPEMKRSIGPSTLSELEPRPTEAKPLYRNEFHDWSPGFPSRNAEDGLFQHESSPSVEPDSLSEASEGPQAKNGL
ncbi:hypothetical protein X801_00277 [Opisthorchis viverrini]|uniref:Leucine Rich repeat-containing domain protein n=1 Tax=Opisthorchis viverrini TaxID=6198 RepID=A0A1S8XAR6_OPIVI|nr:hypothetical protein X801_00277 [Opisthorchis viverrini]